MPGNGGLEWVNGAAFYTADAGVGAGAADYTQRYVRYRNIRVKTLP